MIRLKTAVLLACSLKIGAILGGASDKDAMSLYDFGINIGLSFQIQDDLLDTFGQQASVGKMIGGDIQQCKKTILYLTALETLQGNQVEFRTLYDSKLPIDEKLPKVIETMNACQVPEKVDSLKDAYLDKALASLEKLDLKDSIVVEELVALGRYIVARSH